MDGQIWLTNHNELVDLHTPIHPLYKFYVNETQYYLSSVYRAVT